MNWVIEKVDHENKEIVLSTEKPRLKVNHAAKMLEHFQTLYSAEIDKAMQECARHQLFLPQGMEVGWGASLAGEPISVPFAGSPVPLGSQEDVEDVDLADRCEQLETALVQSERQRSDAERDAQNLRNEIASLRSGLSVRGYIRASEHKRVQDELADAREALDIERKTVDAHGAAFRLVDAARRVAETRLTTQNTVVECAMRYVKVQSARYQRELLEAIDELERCPK